MHPSALELGRLFFQSYCADKGPCTVIDIGAQNVNGSLKEVCPASFKYVGVDFVAGKGVDVVLSDPYRLPFEDASVDVVVCSSVFEHSQFFWLLFEEVMRILRPDGLFYLNAPSNGYVHRYPVDCWRFYPDSGEALAAWATRSGYSPAVLESFIAGKMSQTIESDAWNDYVAVFLKDAACAERYPGRITSTFPSFSNAHLHERPGEEVNPRQMTDDFELIRTARMERDKLQADFDQVQGALENSQEKIAALQDKFDDALRALDEMRASRSWRYTAWLRGLGTLMGRREHG